MQTTKYQSHFQEPSDYVCYLLTLDRKFSYVGATNNLSRRVRQHNGEIKGGAKYTTSKCGLGEWQPLLHVKGFPNYTSALQFEWRWKKMTQTQRKRHPALTVVEGRLLALSEMFKMERVTKQADPMNNWQLSVIWSLNRRWQDIMYYYGLRPFKLSLKQKH